MKKFNLMVMKDVEVPGVGYYQSVSDGLRIEAEDYAVKEFFMSAIRNKTFISGIRFKGGEDGGSFSGDFMVTNISNNSITLNKV